MGIKNVRLVVAGAGNVGRRFLELLVRQREVLYHSFGLNLIVVGVADSSGAALDEDGLDPDRLVRLKEQGRGVATMPSSGKPGMLAQTMTEIAGAELLVEAVPANYETGQPGLGCIEIALSRGMNVVTANKSPLLIALPRLAAMARSNGVALQYDATVAGGLPAVNIGRRDLAIARILRLEGVLNLTANYVMMRMLDDGMSYELALADAQKVGHAEADPALDVEGWDAAAKLVILAHSVLGFPASLQDVTIEGIEEVTPKVLQQARAEGKRIKLLAVADRDGDAYALRVAPVWLDQQHVLAQLGPKQMGLVYHTDICGTVAVTIVEETPLPTSAAVLRDVVDIYTR